MAGPSPRPMKDCRRGPKFCFRGAHSASGCWWFEYSFGRVKFTEKDGSLACTLSDTVNARSEHQTHFGIHQLWAQETYSRLFEPRWVEAMASFAESEPVFASRCERVGLGEDEVKKLKAQGLTTLAKVAFCCSYTPGSGDDSELIKCLDAALGTPSTLGQKASFRRLFHESLSVTTQEMRSMVEQTEPRRAHPGSSRFRKGRNGLRPSPSACQVCRSGTGWSQVTPSSTAS